jgi:hypothetical protein
MFQVRDESFGTIKYTGRSKAKVVDNNDPAGRGRIIVDHPILGITGWIPYLTPPGMFSVPEIDDLVFVECDCGYESYPVAWGNLNKGDDKTADGVPDQFNRVTPTNRGMYTPAGHTFEMDDGSNPLGDDKGIRLKTAGENSFEILEDKLNDKGLFTITTAGGLIVEFDGTKDAVYMDTNNGEVFELSKANGFQIETPDNGGTSLSMKGGKVEIYTTSLFEITDDSGNSVTIDSSGIKIVDANANEITVDQEGIQILDVNSNDISTSPDGLAIVDANGNEINTSPDGVRLSESSGATLTLNSGKVALGASSAELVDLVVQLMEQVKALTEKIQTLTVPTAVGPSGVPVNAADFALIGTEVDTLKSSLDGIKGSI